MAAMDELALHLQNTELAPILEKVDEVFAERSGRTRAEAMQQEPAGGWWADTWLEVLGEVGNQKVGEYHSMLTGVMLGMPDYESTVIPRTITEPEWQERTRTVSRIHDDVRAAAANWQFVMARMHTGVMWEEMQAMWQHVAPLEENWTAAEEWYDLSNWE
jgi:hypothetical protein